MKTRKSLLGNSPVGPIISAFDISLTRSANVQRLDKFTVVQLKNCADFLGIALVDKRAAKIKSRAIDNLI